MDIYYVPIVGFIKAVIEVSKAQRAYFACHEKGGACWAEYDATWGPFENCGKAYLSTVIGCVAAILILAIWRKLAKG